MKQINENIIVELLTIINLTQLSKIEIINKKSEFVTEITPKNQ